MFSCPLWFIGVETEALTHLRSQRGRDGIGLQAAQLQGATLNLGAHHPASSRLTLSRIRGPGWALEPQAVLDPLLR